MARPKTAERSRLEVPNLRLEGEYIYPSCLPSREVDLSFPSCSNPTPYLHLYLHLDIYILSHSRRNQPRKQTLLLQWPTRNPSLKPSRLVTPTTTLRTSRQSPTSASRSSPKPRSPAARRLSTPSRHGWFSYWATITRSSGTSLSTPCSLSSRRSSRKQPPVVSLASGRRTALSSFSKTHSLSGSSRLLLHSTPTNSQFGPTTPLPSTSSPCGLPSKLRDLARTYNITILSSTTRSRRSGASTSPTDSSLSWSSAPRTPGRRFGQKLSRSSRWKRRSAFSNKRSSMDAQIIF